jgi:transcriptional regulator with XRE-family HTH domain
MTQKNARLAKHLTQQQLAQLAGVSISTITRAEQSPTGWPKNKLARKAVEEALK